jgi:hypothetical protein
MRQRKENGDSSFAKKPVLKKNLTARLTSAMCVCMPLPPSEAVTEQKKKEKRG